MAVAREGEEDTPVVPAPTILRPFLRFAKLPTRALAATRKALDVDEEFRSRVADAVAEEEVGRAGWLYLARPEGWEDELSTLVADAAASAQDQADRRAEHDARRRLAAVQEAARRAEEAVARARAEASEAAAGLAEERRARQAAEDAAGAAGRKADEVLQERDRARAAAAAAKAEVETLRGRVAELEAARRQPGPVPEPAAPPRPPSEDVAAAVEAAPVRSEPVLREAVLPALQEAAEAATRLADTLRAVTAALAPPAREEPASPVAEPAPVPAAPVRRPAAVGRRAVPLPPAVFDDSVEAAEYLVRVSGMVLVVDGYNVSQLGWPMFPIAEQRRRLVDALAELSARTGVDARVVFDGADVQVPGLVPTTARAVRVSFSPPGVEADDVVLDLLGRLPPARPVLVASSDRRVQHGASRAGANVISNEQLMAALRR